MSNHFSKIFLVFLLVLVGLFLIYPTVNAAGLVPCGRLQDDPSTPEVDERHDCTTCDIFALASRVINFVLFTIVPAIAVLFYLWAGLMILLAGAHPGWFATGKTIFKNTTLGLIIIFGAYMITNTILKSLAGNSDYSKSWFRIECTATVQQPPTITKYTCNSLNICVVNSNGRYVNDPTCANECQPAPKSYDCDENNQCVEDPEGYYDTPNCDNECTPSEKFYTCNSSNQCVEDLDGEYDTSNCDNECQPSSSPVAISTSSLPDAVANQGYAQPVNASGGTQPYRYLISAGSLPPGLTFSSNGIITGTPTTAGTYTFTVKVEDSTTPTKQSATKQLGIKVVAAAAGVVISNVAASNITQNSAVITWTTDKPSTTQVEHSTSPSSFPGAPIEATPKTNHLVSLTNLSPNITYYFRTKSSAAGFTATSSVGTFTTSLLSITIASLPDGTVSQNYGQNLQATGGKTPYAWSKISGSLPPGLNLATSGSITGTPTAANTYTFTVKVEDSTTPTKQSATKQLSIKVSPSSALPSCPPIGNLCQPGPTSCTVNTCSGYSAAISQAAAKISISGVNSSSIIRSIMFNESTCNVSAYNSTRDPKGNLVESCGPMQMQPETADRFDTRCGLPDKSVTCDFLRNPANINATVCLGAMYIQSIAGGTCGSQVRNIAAGYNAGIGNCAPDPECASSKSCDDSAVRKWECPYDRVDNQVVCNTKLNETRVYAPRVLACYNKQ